MTTGALAQFANLAFLNFAPHRHSKTGRRDVIASVH